MTEPTPLSPTERIIKWTTAGAVVCVAAVAAVVSYDHAYALVRSYGEDGWTARLVPLTVDGLIYASSMVMLHSARRRTPVPVLARWLRGLGIAATLAANAAHGPEYGLVGAMVAAWPALALVGSYELLMLMVRNMGRGMELEPASDDPLEPVPDMRPIALVVPRRTDTQDELQEIHYPNSEAPAPHRYCGSTPRRSPRTRPFRWCLWRGLWSSRTSSGYANSPP